jgi:hypothetical protein
VDPRIGSHGMCSATCTPTQRRRWHGGSPTFGAKEGAAGGSVKHAANSRSKTCGTPRNRGKGNAGAKKLGSSPKATMVERAVSTYKVLNG